jgi:transposase-like protein
MQEKTIRRTFSEEFRRKKVWEIENKLTTVSQVSREYQISRTGVYYWLKKYSNHYEPSLKVVLQMESEEEKTKKLQSRIEELERALGRKQMELDYLNKLIEIEGNRLGEDLKKKAGLPPSNGSGQTKQNIPGR